MRFFGLASPDRGAAIGRFAADERPSRRRLVSDAIDEGLWPHAFQSREAPDWVNRALGLSLRGAAPLRSVMTSLRGCRLSCAIQTTFAAAARPQLPWRESRTDESIRLKKPVCPDGAAGQSSKRAELAFFASPQNPQWFWPCAAFSVSLLTTERAVNDRARSFFPAPGLVSDRGQTGLVTGLKRVLGASSWIVPRQCP
jgi:hypothetical protein